MFKLVPFLLLAIPLVEIAAFVVIGERIGVAMTLALILVTALIGTILLRIQGFGIISRIQAEIAHDRLPGAELVHGAMILVAGILLLTPGFLTDALGFLLFVPAIRSAIWRAIRARMDFFVVDDVEPFSRSTFRSSDDRGPIVDLGEDDYQRRDDEDEPVPRRDTPWREDR